MIDGIRVKDQALRRFVQSLDAKTATTLAVAHARAVTDDVKKSSKMKSRMTWNGKSGYKREWGHFWKSKNENEKWRWRTRFANRPEKYSGIKYDKPFRDVAGRESSQFMMDKFVEKAKPLMFIVENYADYSGYVIGIKKHQSNKMRKRGWIGIEEGAHRTERKRQIITEQTLHNKARKAGGA